MVSRTSPSISLANEFARAPLGDARRTARVTSIAETLSASPSASLPSLLDPAGLEAAYRLMSNDAVSFQELLEGHTHETARRCDQGQVMLAVHDTTELAFPLRDDVYREHLSQLTTRRQGFYLHASLAVSADGARRPLGMMAARPYVHHSGVEHCDETRAFWRQHEGLFDNENDRWLQSVEAAEHTIEQGRHDPADDRVRLVHIADQEGDSYEFFASMVELEREFVVRAGKNRSVTREGGQTSLLFEALEDISFFDETRTVELSPRTANRSAKDKKRHPPRRKRTSVLSFRSQKVTIRRPRNKPALDHLPPSVELTVVEAVERQPPEGEPAVRWLLFTTESCETIEDTLRVVDWYRSRWLIEEYFKALKTGCNYEARQFGSAHALLNMLATTLVVAVGLLELRYLSRHRPDEPADRLFNSMQVKMLDALLPNKHIPPDVAIGDALLAVAALGGHLKHNGPPGWLTLYRGYTKLLDAEAGWKAMQALGEM